jgi:hypothetical protein
MIKFLTAASFSLMIFAMSCKDNPDKEADDTEIADADSLDIEKVDTVLSNETISFFNQSGFSEFAKSKSPQFDWSKFRMTDSWQDDSLTVVDFKPAANYFDTYKTLLKYSPDSTRFLDLDSYNIAIDKDKNGRLSGNESGPDTEISMVNVRSNKKTRLLFSGPGSSVEDGSWIDNDNVVLMGFQETAPASNAAPAQASGSNTGGKVPVIWRYNLTTSTYYIYELPDPKVASQLMGEWKKQRLKGIKLN